MPRPLPNILLFGLLAALPAVPFVHADTTAPRVIPVAAANITGKVVGVHDGDSLTLYSGPGLQLKIRLDGIDAPELKQAFGAAAKRRLSDLVFGKQILVEVKGKDRYGRTLGIVRSESRNVNLEMVRSGFAWHFVRYSGDIRLAEAEKRARSARIGLWAALSAVSPWDFRSRSVER